MTTLRCKAGDLAIIVGAGKVPENVGRFVIVDRRAIAGKDVHPSCGDIAAWVVRSACGDNLMVMLINGSTEMRHEVPVADYDLRPIRPNEGEDESLSWSRPVVTEAA